MKKLFGDDENTAKPRATETRAITLNYGDYRATRYGVSTLEDLKQFPIPKPKRDDWLIVSFHSPQKFLDEESQPYWQTLNQPHDKNVIHHLDMMTPPIHLTKKIIEKIESCRYIDEITINGFINNLDLIDIRSFGYAIRSSCAKKANIDYFTNQISSEKLSTLFESLSGSQSIVALDLTQTYLNNEAIFDTFVAMLTTLPNLKSLTLCGCAIRKEDLPKLSGVLPTLKHLAQLDLRENQSLTAKDCYSLAISIPSLKKLGSDDTYTLRRLNRASKCDIRFFDENFDEKSDLSLTYTEDDPSNTKPIGPQNK